jgi:signal transduction histidine kinase
MVFYAAKQKNIKLSAEIDKISNLDFIQMIYGDERRYLQILLNFLSNSLKFTNEGGEIKVEVKIIESQKVGIDSSPSSS